MFHKPRPPKPDRSAEFASFSLDALHKGVIGGRSTQAIVPQPKDWPARSEAYLRAVALLPCCVCGIEGRSQAAHGPSLGRGIKADDRSAIALCADGPLFRGHHSRIDQYELMDAERRRVFMEQHAKATRKEIRRLGLWPKGLEWIE